MPIIYYTEQEAYKLAVKTARLYANLVESGSEIMRLADTATAQQLPKGLEAKFNDSYTPFFKELSVQITSELTRPTKDLNLEAVPIALARIKFRKIEK